MNLKVIALIPLTLLVLSCDHSETEKIAGGWTVIDGSMNEDSLNTSGGISSNMVSFIEDGTCIFPVVSEDFSLERIDDRRGEWEVDEKLNSLMIKSSNRWINGRISYQFMIDEEEERLLMKLNWQGNELLLSKSFVDFKREKGDW